VVVVEKPRIGICFSGGGFRAAFYALGCLRYLAEADLLDSVVSVSAVSGGSLATAALADRWGELSSAGFGVDAFMREVDGPLRTPVTETDIRRKWALRAAKARLRGDRRGRGLVLGDVLGELYRTENIAQLPPGVQAIFNSTDLGTGRAFRMCRDFIGGFGFGYPAPSADLKLGTAVAASAAFPFVFAPVSLATAGLGLEKAPPVLALVDGGVYDNLGLEWFQGWKDSRRPAAAASADFLIVANASGPLLPVEAPFGGLRALKREKSVQYAQTLNGRIRWYVEWLLEREDKKGIYLGILRDPRRYVDVDENPVDSTFYEGALPSSFVTPLARLRTDLDRFLPEEATLLSYHGYWSLHARLMTFFPQYAIAPTWREFAEITPAEEQPLLALLERGTGFALYR